MRSTMYAGRILKGILAAGALSLGVVAAQAATWTNAAGGFYDVGDNWEEGSAPGIGVAALYGIDAAYTVTLRDDVENAGVTVRDGAVVWDLGGYTYQTGGETTQILGIGTGGTQPASLTVTNGLLQSSAFRMGEGRDGALTLTGSNTAWTNSGTSTHASIGYNANGSLRIENGAQAAFNGMYINLGSAPTASEVMIAGPLSTLTLNGPLLWRYNEGEVHAKDGAIINLNSGDSMMGMQADSSSATFMVDNAFVNNRGLLRVGASLNTSAILTMKNGAVWTNHAGGTLQIGRASTTEGLVVVESGSRLVHSSTEWLYASYSGPGSLLVRDALSEVLLEDGGLRLGGGTADAQGSIVVHTGALLRVENNLESVAPAGEGGLIEVAGSGARLEAGGLWVGLFTGQTTTRGVASLTIADEGLVDVSGTLRVSAISTISLDKATARTGNFDLLTGATFKATLHAAQAGGGALVTVTNDAMIDGAVFELALAEGYTPSRGSQFILMQVDGTLTGEFEGIEDGATVWTDPEDPDLYMWINYNLGGNDSITLTVIPEPGALTLLALAGLGLLVLRRSR